MTAKEYLYQAYRLDQRIKADMAEAAGIRELAGTAASPRHDVERVQATRPAEAPFIRALEKLWELEEQINSEIEKLAALKAQIRETIKSVPDHDERMVLWYHYVQGMAWTEVAREMYADRSTVCRWHGNALEHLQMPENPIVI